MIATSVAAINSVRRLNRHLSQGIEPMPTHSKSGSHNGNNTHNPYGSCMKWSHRIGSFKSRLIKALLADLAT